jgi:predicted RNase H-like HicB family nuclease
MKKYLVVLEPPAHNWAAYSPDLPGCVATGKTRDETLRQMREAVNFQIDGLREEGLPIPEPS